MSGGVEATNVEHRSGDLARLVIGGCRRRHGRDLGPGRDLRRHEHLQGGQRPPEQPRRSGRRARRTGHDLVRPRRRRAPARRPVVPRGPGRRDRGRRGVGHRCRAQRAPRYEIGLGARHRRADGERSRVPVGDGGDRYRPRHRPRALSRASAAPARVPPRAPDRARHDVPRHRAGVRRHRWSVPRARRRRGRARCVRRAERAADVGPGRGRAPGGRARAWGPGPLTDPLPGRDDSRRHAPERPGPGARVRTGPARRSGLGEALAQRHVQGPRSPGVRQPAPDRRAPRVRGDDRGARPTSVRHERSGPGPGARTSSSPFSTSPRDARWRRSATTSPTRCSPTRGARSTVCTRPGSPTA